MLGAEEYELVILHSVTYTSQQMSAHVILSPVLDHRCYSREPKRTSPHHRTYFIFCSQSIALGGEKQLRLKLIDLKVENIGPNSKPIDDGRMSHT